MAAMSADGEVNKILNDLANGLFDEEEAKRRLVALGVNPDNAEEWIWISKGGDDVIEEEGPERH
jgi:hypothetical protein